MPPDPWLTTYVCESDRYVAVLESGKYDCPLCGEPLDAYPLGSPTVADLLTKWVGPAGVRGRGSFRFGLPSEATRGARMETDDEQEDRECALPDAHGPGRARGRAEQPPTA